MKTAEDFNREEVLTTNFINLGGKESKEGSRGGNNTMP
jgi:hypothetical protein